MAYEEVVIGEARLLCGKAEEVLPTLPDASVQLIVTDPPYMGVKLEYEGKKLEWDRQWKTRDAYLGWLRGIAKEWRRVLTANGSVYVFASPHMAAWVEVTLSEVFHIIQRITWAKPAFSTKAEMFDKDTCRMYFPASEAIIFAEQYGSDQPFADALIDGNKTYWSACTQTKGSIFGNYLKAEMERAGATRREITALFPSCTGNPTGCLSNWLIGHNIPTREQYHTIRDYLNTKYGTHDYLRRDYEELRRDYEELRRDYEELRRPFDISPSVPYNDTWTFPTVSFSPGKHPAEKPLALLRHCIMASSRPGGVVLDSFAGSFSTADAARQCGRHSISIEQDRAWWLKGQVRMSQEDLFTMPAPVQRTPVLVQPSFFGKEPR